MRTLFAGRRGDQCIIFRNQGSTDPPWGASQVLCLYNCLRQIILPYGCQFVGSNLDRGVRKPVFGVSKLKFKPAYSASVTSYKIEIWFVASLDMIHSNKRITKMLIRLRGCAGWSAPLLFVNHQRQAFSLPGPLVYHRFYVAGTNSRGLISYI